MICEGISFAYGAQQILDGVSFSVPDGAYTALIGPNGSGKTTLMSILSGFTKPSVGRVTHGGRDVHKMRIRDRAQIFAVVQQRETVSMPFSCLEVVLMGFHPHLSRFNGLARSDYEQARAHMAETGTEAFMNKRIDQLSGGEFQRVILTRALAQRPKILFLDEAMSDLDISARMECMRLIKGAINKTGMTVLAIHHDISAAYLFADQVIALKGGEIHAQGVPSSVMMDRNMRNIFGVQVEVIEGKGLLILDGGDK